MPLSKQHKAQTRNTIVGSAGRVFRRKGYHAAGIDTLMGEAGLTRGGFYAHFASKSELFAAVMAGDYWLTRALTARDAETPELWRAQTLALLSDYLNPAHMDEVARGCNFAALTADASRGDAAVREAYRLAFDGLVAQLLRRQGETAVAAVARASAHQRNVAVQVAVTAIGALSIAAALGAGESAQAALERALALVRQWMDGC